MSGHLFLVHGKIGELTHDAALVPVASTYALQQDLETAPGEMAVGTFYLV